MATREQIEVIKKTQGNIIKPNLNDYDEQYKLASWEKARETLGLNGDHLNIADWILTKHKGTKIWSKSALIVDSGEQDVSTYSYEGLYRLSNKWASALQKMGIKKGDKVFIFMPKCAEVYVSFLGILKCGAVAGTMFAAFGEDAIKQRLGDCEAKAVITSPELKGRIDNVEKDLPNLKTIIVADKKAHDTNKCDKEVCYYCLIDEGSDAFEAVKTKAEDPAFILYTSGTTGKSKGVIHAHRAVVQQYFTSKWVLDLKEDDTYWCTADHGWVTGISYGIIGPLACGVRQVIYSGRFDPQMWYTMIDKYKVTVFYTAPTAVRMLMKSGENITKKFGFNSLRHLCSVGEPLNPEAIRWGLKVFGLAFHDTWWQTETGAMLICNYPSMDIKLGSMGKPVPGVEATIIDDKGNELGEGAHGNLAVKPGWPSMMKEIYKNPEKYKEYFVNGWYTTGDKAYKDRDGYFWFIGRADDVINTSGERVGPFEVESALVEHPAIAEAGVIGKPDALRGEIIKAFVTLRAGNEWSDDLYEELKALVKKRLAGHAYPREIDVVDSLPKTSSGKIMRRVLKARELGLDEGDTSTLEKD